MKNLLLTLFALIVMATSVSFGQEEMFKVLASKGANKIAVPNSSEWRIIKIGEKINKADKITIVENGYLGLAHKSGKTIELKKAGVYPVEKLASEVTAQNATMGKKYVDFVVGEVTSKDEDMTKNRHKYMAVTGSVERGMNDIHAFIPRDAYFITSPLTIKWQATKNVKTYVVKVTNMFDEPIYKTETTETSAVIDLSKVDMKDDKQVFILSIISKENPNIKSDQFALKHLPKDKSDAISKQTLELKKDLSDETALNKVVLASFYEENKLLLNAVESYEEAIKMEPEVDDYKGLYSNFLTRNELSATK
jgi:hypothetical protein